MIFEPQDDVFEPVASLSGDLSIHGSVLNQKSESYG